MRILNVIESLGHGGAEQVLLNVLPHLQARGHICEVATLWSPYKPRGNSGQAFSTSRSLRGDMEEAGVRVHRLPWSYSRRWHLLTAAARINVLARRLGCDVVHAHLLFADLYVGLGRAMLPGVTRVASLQNMDFDFLSASIPGRVAGRILPPVLRHGFDGFAAVGAPVAAHFEQHVPGLPLEIIVNAVPLPDLSRHASSAQSRAATLRRHGADAARFVILVAARLAPEKNHAVLLEALDLLRGRGREPQVLLAGVGATRAELERLTRDKKLGAQVIFCGHVERTMLPNLMLASDAFVLPSQHEGLPLALAEAMSLRRPVLATRVGGVPDLIEHERSGLLVPPSDAPALAAAIERLMDDGALRDRLGRDARERIERHFSAHAVAEQWEGFYQRAIERHRGRS